MDPASTTTRRTILLLLGGLALYWFIGIALAALLKPSPLTGQTLATITPVALFAWLAWKKRVFPGTTRTIVPRALLISGPFFVVLLNWLTNPIDYPGLAAAARQDPIQILRVIIFCLLVGTGEELFFRGYALSLLTRWRVPLAILINGLVFGLLHYSQGWTNTWIAVVIGLAFALARVARTPLWLLAVLHGLTNFPVHMPNLETPHHAHNIGAAIIAYLLIITAAYLAFPSNWAKPPPEAPRQLQI